MFGIDINNWNKWFLVILFLVIYEVITHFLIKYLKLGKDIIFKILNQTNWYE